MTGLGSSCAEIAAAVQAHQITARSACDEALAAAERHQERFHAFIQLTPELARKQAERVDALIGMGRRLPLAGVPFAVKDLIDVKGVPTTAGSAVFAARRAEQDATAIKKLTAMGAVLIGKLNMHECAFGFTGENPHYGDCRNPWNPERIPGGSSSGSAVAAALSICPFTLGSDTGGSIRLPAALCNVVGLKPTYGRVSRAGVMPLAWTLDHVGPMARSVQDVGLIFRMLAGHDPLDPASLKQPVPDYLEEMKKPPAGLRIGIPTNRFFAEVHPDVHAAVQQAVAELVKAGVQTVEVELPLLDEILGAHRAIIFSEAAEFHRPHLQARGGKYTEGIRQMLATGLFLSARDYLQAQRVRSVVRSAWQRTFQEFDVLALPTTPIVATAFNQSSVTPRGQELPLVRAFLDFTLPFNLTGYPALSLPCGFSSDKLPIGLQLVARPLDEAALLRLGHHYQQQTDWHQRRPPVD